MIDFGKISEPVKITPEFILSKITEEMIFFHYFGRFELGKVYPSKFRKDKNPSTGFFIHPLSRSILYNDLSTGEKLNCFMFVAKLHNITYLEALKTIACDFGLIKGCESKSSARHAINTSISFDREIKKETLIQFIPGKWTFERLAYWSAYGLTSEDLKKNDVYPVDKLFINKVEYRNLDHLCFAYVVKERVRGEKEPRIYVKIYSPYSTNMKWLSNIPITVPFGLYDLKYGTDHIVVGKAQKDRMVLMKFFESVIGTQNESEAALPLYLVKHLCFNFQKRTIMWDADSTGVENCKKFNSRGFGYFNTPKFLLEEGIKDVSDFVAVYGMKALEELLKQKRLL